MLVLGLHDVSVKSPEMIWQILSPSFIARGFIEGETSVPPLRSKRTNFLALSSPMLFWNDLGMQGCRMRPTITFDPPTLISILKDDRRIERPFPLFLLAPQKCLPKEKLTDKQWLCVLWRIKRKPTSLSIWCYVRKNSTSMKVSCFRLSYRNFSAELFMSLFSAMVRWVSSFACI